MTPEHRAGLLVDLSAHVAARAPRLLEEPPSPAGCVVLFAIELGSVAHAIGPFDLPEHGVYSAGKPGSSR